MESRYFKLKYILFYFFLSFFALNASAQTGPAGIGNSDGTGGQPRNILWLDASKLVLSDGTNVSAWGDNSGNAYNASSATGNEPVFKISDPNINNKPYVEFTASNADFINLPAEINSSANGILNNNYNCIIVAARRTDASAWLVGGVDQVNNENLHIGWRGTGNNFTSAHYSNDLNTNATIALNNYGIFTTDFNSSLASNHRKLFENGNLLNAINSTTALSSWNTPRLGMRYTNEYSDLNISEVIFYKGALTNPQRIIVTNYLSQKYNLTITDDFFGTGVNFNTAYIGDIMGIGTTNGTDKVTSSGSSSALLIKERNGTLDGTNEFLMFAHNSNIAHSQGIISNIGTGITSRWAKDYYVEVSQNGVIDGGAIDVEMAFDFGDAGLGSIGSASEYVLLYRETSGGTFEQVVANQYYIANGDQLVASIASSRLKTGYYTLGKGTQQTTDTWYVFQDGNWSDPGTWTMDASTAPIFNNPSNEIPGPGDQVIIRSGRTVTIQGTTNNILINSIEVKGNLYLTTSTGHNFTTINGNGQIYLQGNSGNENFPDGVTTGNIGFGDPDNGGTLVIAGTGDMILPTNRTFKNVLINRNVNSDKVILASNYVLNGNFTIGKGVFQFGNNTTVRSLVVEKKTLVEATGSVVTYNANIRHTFELKGDFVNNGSVKFTNRADFNSTADRYDPNNTFYQNDDTNGTVETTFSSGTQDQVVDCNNTTFFSRIVIDKGIDQTYTLFLQATDSANFRLLGRADNNDADGDNMIPDDNSVAFALIKGTVKLDNNIIVPVLSAGTNYAIPTAARLWIDGGYIRKTVGTAIVPYGVVEISEGTLISTVGSGITLRETGKVKIDGGNVRIGAFRTSVQGPSAQGSYEQNGGNVTIIGGGSISSDYALFSLTYTGNVFKMTGGTLEIRGRSNLGTGSLRGSIFINSDPANQQVTGGTVIFESNTTTLYKITSRAPFYNVIMRAGISSAGNIELAGTTSGTDDIALVAQKLVVINDLIINGYSDDFKNNPKGNFPITFAPVTSATNVNDVYVGGSFYIGNNSNYLPVFGGSIPYDAIADQPLYRNTTFFNKTTASSTVDTLYYGNTDQLELGSIVLDRTVSSQLRTIAREEIAGGIRFDINGNISILAGTLDQHASSFRIWGDITNYGRLGTYFTSGNYPVSGGTPSLAQIHFGEVPSLSFTTSDDAIFGNIRFNIGTTSQVDFNSDVYMERMEYWNGRIYLKNHTLTVDQIWNINNGGGEYFNNNVATSSFIKINDTDAVDNILIFTDGKASDGGLKLKINGNTSAEDASSRINNISPITFPVGFTTDGGVTIYSRPAQLKIKDYADDGYIQINAVSGVMQTSNLSGGEILEHYWRVRHDGFTTVPKVATRFYYRNIDNGSMVDIQAGSSEQDNYVPGYVLDGGAYTRQFEDITDIFSSTFDANVKCIVFNGPSTGGDFDQVTFSGFPLINANFTTGQSNRFTGAPKIYYTRLSNNTDWYNRSWENGDNWSLVPHTSDSDNNLRPVAGTWPQAGDIAVIGYGGYTGGIAPIHSINIDDGDIISVANIVFDNPSSNSNRLVIDRSATLNFGTIDGTGGTFMEKPNNPGVFATISGDFGAFYSSNTFTYSYYLDGIGTYNITPPTSVFPNLRVEGGDNNRIAIFQNDIVVNGDFTVDGNTIVRTNNGLEGDIVVKKALRIGGYNGGNFEFNDGMMRTVEVGDIWFRGNSSTSNLTVRNITPNSISHRLLLNGSIIQERPGDFDLRGGTGPTANNAVLELKGSGNHNYTKTSGNTADFFKIIMNKGVNATNSFTFSEAFNIPDASTAFQPIEILNGILILDNAQINLGAGILLANGSNFPLPNTNNPLSSSGSGGLELLAGKVSISGNNTGMILDGKLAITGGEVDMATATGNGNNFIEYSSSGKAEIVLSAGSLKVGSQVRRSTTSTSGILKYTQTGGIAQFGVRAAPTAIRGVFEIENDGSVFNLDIDPALGHEFTIVRDNNSTTVPTLLLSPQTNTITSGSVITLGNATTPSTQDRLGVYSDIPLKNLHLRSNNITARLYALPLTVDVLDIGSGTFNANGFNLTVNTSMINNGTFAASGNSLNNQVTNFPSAGATTISGGGTTNFWNLNKSGAGTLILSKDITVLNNASLLGGTINTTTYAFNIKKDMVHDAIHTSAVAGPGIIFNGTQKQNLSRSDIGTSEFGVLEVNNASGLIISGNGQDFQVNSKLILNTGVMDIGGNLLIFPVGANITNKAGGSSRTDFNVNRMIQTNSSIKDFGVRKFFPATTGGSINFIYPVGLTSYTPVEMNITHISAGEITVRPVADIPPINLDDVEGVNGCLDQEIVDSENVLQYYWILKSNNINGLNGSMKMYYDEANLKVTSPYAAANYGPARLYTLDNTWDKVFTTADFDESSQWINFPFTNNNDATLAGHYTAGVTLESNGTSLLCGAAIPDMMPEFTTLEATNSGNVYVGGSYQGAVSPNPGNSFDLIVKSGYTLVYDVNSVRTRKITIEAGATLEIANGSNNHNLGFITGSGNIKMVSNTSSVSFPTGDYESFFPGASCAGGGGLEYAGTGNYPVLSDIPAIRNVVFSGSGTRTLPNNHHLRICEDLEILGNVDLLVPDGGNRTTILGNIYKADNSTFQNGGGSSEIILNGSARQYIHGDFKDTNGFNYLTIDNASGLSVINAADATRGISANGDVDVEGLLTFANGKIFTDNDNSLRLRSGGTITGYTSTAYTSTRYVDGPFVREIANYTQEFDFPIGKGGRYGFMRVIDPNGGAGLKNWTVEYFNAPPISNPQVTSSTPADPLILNISGNEYWVVNDGLAGSDGQKAMIGLSWDNSSDVSAIATERDKLTVMAWNNTSKNWDSKGGASINGTSQSFGTLQSSGELTFSENIVTLGSTDINNPLPVELISFTGKVQDGLVLLAWKTASEQNNDYFQIEHSVDGKVFIEIGRVFGAGTTTVLQQYAFEHGRPNYPDNYYRLKQVDFDGAFEYSDVILVRLRNELISTVMNFVMYPNPTTDAQVSIEIADADISKPLMVEVIALNGSKVKSDMYAAGDFYHTIQLNLGYAAKQGVYIVRLSQGDQIVVKKLILN